MVKGETRVLSETYSLSEFEFQAENTIPLIQSQSSNTKFELNLALKLESGTYKLALGVLILTHQSLQRSELNYDYGHSILRRMNLDHESGLNLVKALVSTNMITLPDYRKFESLTESATPVFSPSKQNEYILTTTWPTRILEYSCDKDDNIRHGYSPLSAKGLPLYPDFSRAIPHFLDLEAPLGSTFNNFGRFKVLIPDYRARLGRLRIRYTKLSVEVVTLDNPLSDFELRIYSSNKNKVRQLKDLPCDSTRTDHELGFDPDHVLVHLANKTSGEVIDVREWSTSWSRQGDIVLERTEDQIKEIIARGENSSVEFKSTFDEKSNEFAESVVAFSNTNDGIIILGVNDHGQIVGSRTDDDSVLKRVRDTCEPDINLKIRRYDLGDNEVVLIEVSKGNNPPYLLKNKGVMYVRKGANDFPGSRSDYDEIKRDDIVNMRAINQ